jgi:hypothetical protein
MNNPASGGVIHIHSLTRNKTFDTFLGGHYKEVSVTAVHREYVIRFGLFLYLVAMFVPMKTVVLEPLGFIAALFGNEEMLEPRPFMGFQLAIGASLACLPVPGRFDPSAILPLGWTYSNALMFGTMFFASRKELKRPTSVRVLFIPAIAFTGYAVIVSVQSAYAFFPHACVWALSFLVVGTGHLWPYPGSWMQHPSQRYSS